MYKWLTSLTAALLLSCTGEPESTRVYTEARNPGMEQKTQTEEYKTGYKRNFFLSLLLDPRGSDKNPSLKDFFNYFPTEEKEPSLKDFFRP